MKNEKEKKVKESCYDPARLGDLTKNGTSEGKNKYLEKGNVMTLSENMFSLR